jgi:hypothetical protein
MENAGPVGQQFPLNLSVIMGNTITSVLLRLQMKDVKFLLGTGAPGLHIRTSCISDKKVKYNGNKSDGFQGITLTFSLIPPFLQIAEFYLVQVDSYFLA